MLHQRGHGDDVHVAPREDGHHVFPLAAQMPQGGDGQQPGVLHDHLVLFHHVQEGVHQLSVVNGEDVVQILLDVGEDLVPGRLDRHAVGDGVHAGQGDDMARVQAGAHGGRPGGLHPDDLYIGVEQLGQGGHPRGQSAAADRHQDDVHVGQVGEDLIGDGALAGGQHRVVEGVDIGVALRLGELGGQLGGVVEGGPPEHHVGPVVLGVVYLHQRSGGGHHHRGAHPGVLGGIGHSLGVVAGGGGDQSPILLLLGEGADLVVGPPDLIGSRDLQVLRLDVYVILCGLGKSGGVDQRRGPDHAGQDTAGRLKIF